MPQLQVLKGPKRCNKEDTYLYLGNEDSGTVRRELMEAMEWLKGCDTTGDVLTSQ